ncbi:MAG: hypothetical protein SGBAC_012553 [Bacillariaceae sp.]
MDATQGNDPVNNKTVLFNVGGKIYEISKSLLQAFPNTLLATKASTQTVSPIFIDRDADRFAYCLDFMRDNGKVHLSETVSKTSLVEELKYFGFANIDEALINDTWSKRQTAMRIADIIMESEQNIMESEQNIIDMDRKVKLERIALHLFKEFLKDPKDATFFQIGNKGCPFEEKMPGLMRDIRKDDYFRKCLDKYGVDSRKFDDEKHPHHVYIQRKSTLSHVDPGRLVKHEEA